MSELQHLLNQGGNFDPRYLPDLNSDHLPMTLCAMSGLGASTVDLHAFRDAYAPRLRPATSGIAITDWQAAIGHPDAYPALRAWLQGEVERQGISETVARYLPDFMASMAVEAFHPVIRLGYAIDFQSTSETAAALAYLMTSHRPIAIDDGQPVNMGEALANQAKGKPRLFTSSRFGDRVQELVDDGDYPNVQPESFADCAAAALAVYMGTRNFFALHMVTVTHAARICARVVAPGLVLHSLGSALLAAHRVVQSPEFGNPAPIPHGLDPEHAYKYAWSCLSEHREYGELTYLREIESLRNGGLIPDWCDWA